ncbi:membrane-fusion protein [Methyloprofundus sedimenti]|uniref:Membrane-fusion protein n=1 Tax=Methyloprofundus sedimenti TaxID=1420851 RepID=A0A1V8MA44_9GAMM|nr:HlyD family secretion protein [Methyloprofundus sedimenti]OQK18406.1 membrane-fusion protein [Methyloprofundus sedimenti]
MKKVFQNAFILPLIAITALALVIYKIKSAPPAQHEVLQFPVKTVEVITLKKLPFRSRAMAYGNVEPAVLVKAKTEVSGKISYIHPALKKGASLAKGTVVIRIEPTAFEFSLDQSEAGLAGSQSSLEQLEVEESSTRRSLEIAKKNLHTGTKELNRLLSVWEKRLIARSTVDAEEQKVLLLQQQVEDLQGRLASYTSRKSVSQAQIKQSKTQLAQSQDTLGRTEIRLPFDARIGEVLVEKGEYTPVGSVLFEALGTQAIEINAQLSVRQFYPMLMGFGDQRLNLQNPQDMQSAFAKIKMQASVSLVGYEGISTKWQGELLRISESIDPVRDTIGLVVAVNNPYTGVIPGKRPPLLKGMYAAVEFFSPARGMLVIPRKAIHQGRVYVAKENASGTNYQLEIRPLNILHKQGQLVVVSDGVKEGEKIIITDVTPVINGLPLKLVMASEYEKQMAKEAAGEEAISPNHINGNKVNDSDNLVSPPELIEGVVQ